MERKPPSSAPPLQEGSLLRLLETTRVIPWEADAQTWEFTYVGAQAVTLLGYPLERWFETGFWTETIHPADREFAITFCKQSLRRCSEYEFEYRMIAADGRTVWLHDVVNVDTKYGEPSVLRGFMIDITQRKKAEAALRESEAKYKDLYEHAPDMFVSIDAVTGRVINCNETFVRKTGFERVEVLARSVFDLYDPSVRERVERAFRTVHTTGKVQDAEFSVRCKDGSTIPVSVNVSAVRDIHGNLLHTRSILRDIRAHRHAEQEARRHHEDLARVARAATLGELAAALAHELNQPLCAIVSNAQAAQRFLASDAPDMKETNAAVAEIARDGRRAADLIVRLRALMQKRESQAAPVDLNRCVNNVVALLHTDKAESIRTELQEGLPDVSGDGIELEQVILNLVRNGMDAMKNDGQDALELTIRTSQANGHVAVTVTDRGPGFRPDAVAHVFEPFYTTKEGGLGMGLSISRTIVRAHGGSIAAGNDVQGGAVVQFTLPIAES